MKKFRIGVIGAGSIARHAHIPGYAAASNCVLTAIADPDAGCLQKVAEQGWRFAGVYSDYREMLKKEKLDVVSVCAPNVFHKAMAVAALEKGCDLLLEKPVALTMADAEAIRSSARRKRRRIMVAFSHRFNELNVAARKAVRAGRIGKLYMLRVRFAHTGPWPGWASTGWFYNPKLAGGGAMLDMAIHAFDLVQWFAGPVTAMQAKVATLRKPIQVDDNAVALLEFGPKCLGYVEAGWTSPAGYCGVELMGDNGAIFVDYSQNKTIMVSGVRTPDGKSRQRTAVLQEGGPASWKAQMGHFTRQLGRRGPFRVGIEDGISALRVALAAYQSSRTGRRVVLRGG
ncbi:MAG: Gfo/Idh/MocA family oxidoreductase [Lentisphaerae bacterium]|nr:Gfo/Idh/MocA family oxidoreductase [Lentisphaerota bacterium]